MTNKTIDALKLAEEALDELRYANDTDIAKTKYYKALAAIREALAAQDHIADAGKMVAEPVLERDARILAVADDLLKIVEAVGHIGVDFGFGEFHLEQSHIEKARSTFIKITEGGGMSNQNKRPQNCGTSYCSCIECIYGDNGCVADEEQCNDGCLARESVIANALKLADEIDAEFSQGRISNHNGRKAAQMLRMLVDAPVQPVKQEPVAWLNPHNQAVIDGRKKKQIGEGNGYPNFSIPLYAAPVSAECAAAIRGLK